MRNKWYSNQFGQKKGKQQASVEIGQWVIRWVCPAKPTMVLVVGLAGVYVDRTLLGHIQRSTVLAV